MASKGFYKVMQNQQGVILLLTILILVGILAIALGVTSLMIGEIKITREIPLALKAYYAAEVGIERKLYEMRRADPLNSDNIGNPPNCSVGSGATCLDGSDVCYSVNVTVGNPTIIKSYGCHKRIKRSVEVSY